MSAGEYVVLPTSAPSAADAPDGASASTARELVGDALLNRVLAFCAPEDVDPLTAHTIRTELRSYAKARTTDSFPYSSFRFDWVEGVFAILVHRLLLSAGYTVTFEQVEGLKRRRPDLVLTAPDGTLHVIEFKRIEYEFIVTGTAALKKYMKNLGTSFESEIPKGKRSSKVDLWFNSHRLAITDGLADVSGAVYPGGADDEERRPQVHLPSLLVKNFGVIKPVSQIVEESETEKNVSWFKTKDTAKDVGASSATIVPFVGVNLYSFAPPGLELKVTDA